VSVLLLSSVFAQSAHVSPPTCGPAAMQDPQPAKAADPPAATPDVKAVAVPDPAPPGERWESGWSRSASARRLHAGFSLPGARPGEGAPLFDKSAKTYLLDSQRGPDVCPSSPKVGPCDPRQDDPAGSVYFVIFGNPACYIKPATRSRW